MGATVVALTVANRGIDAPAGLRPHLSDALFALAMAAFAVVGALVATRRPGNVVGWLLLAQGLLWELGLMCAGWVAHAVFTAPGSLPFPEFAGWLLAWIWAPAIAGVALLVLLFPDGRLPSRRWRVVVVLIVVSASLSGLAAALRPGPLVHVGSLVNPVGVEGAQGTLDVAAAVGGVLYAAALVATFVAFVRRFRRASTIERQQLSWFAVAVAIVALATTLATVLDALGVPETATSLLNTLPLVALPVAVAVAVLRHRLYDIDLVLDRALVGAGLAAFTTLVYLVVVVAVGTAVGRGTRSDVGLATLATAIVALALQPLHARMRRLSARLVYGRPASSPPPRSPPEHAEPEPVAPMQPTVPSVEVRTLGGFRVLRDGQLLSTSAWQSRKARTLLKILIARRGRPVPREQLMELLWPDEDPAPLGNRLSVALATLRSVLDPGKRAPGDHFVRGQKDAVALDLTHVEVDVEAFLADVEAGLAAERQGEDAESERELERAEHRYAGDFLEEDVYEDWSIALRDEAATAYAATLRARARGASRRGDTDSAARAHLRLLDRDRWDGSAHLDLVALLHAAGRHGEARRRYRTYASAMAEIDVRPDEFPAAQAGSQPARSSL